MSKFVLKEAFIISGIFLLSAFQSEQGKLSTPEYPDMDFIVISDPHYYDSSLGTTGNTFQEYLDNDRKLLKESPEILNEASSYIVNSSADFIIIPGDLTKDGTLLSHQKFADYLSKIEKSGKEVYVIPGNHDVSNPESFSYGDTAKTLVENVDPERFQTIYAEFGYNEAIYQDPFSLSYIVEPVEGFWLFAMDACLYSDNKPGNHSVTGGKFNEKTLIWLENMLNLALNMNKSVMGFMHHGILEHYKKQSRFFYEYVVDDYKNISEMFAGRGMKLVFTGHYHAQDVTSEYFANDSFIFDIETGSLVTFPCPIRKVSIKDNIADITSITINRIESHPENFQEFARSFVWSGIEGIAKQTLIDFKLEENEAALLSGQVADAFVAHYQGDEVSPEKAFDLKGVSLKGRFLIGFKKKLVWNLWNDKPPMDNHLRIDLQSGKVEPIRKDELVHLR